MRLREVVIVRTGTANLASVRAGLLRCGVVTRLARDAVAVRTAEHVVVPGVGAFAAAMTRLRADGLQAAVTERVERGLPTLLICVGMQLLCEASEESPGVAGLGVVPGHITRLDQRVRVPQLGWNRVEPDGCQTLLEPGYAYFANSYKLDQAPAGWRAARADHGGCFVAALEREGVLACQFHPELSGPWGLALLRRWVDGASRPGGERC
jgi:imidazole glycerol phosphate synthase glutamine amidotransferase subunit